MYLLPYLPSLFCVKFTRPVRTRTTHVLSSGPLVCIIFLLSGMFFFASPLNYCNKLSFFFFFNAYMASIVVCTASYCPYYLPVFLTSLNCIGLSDSQYIGRFLFYLWCFNRYSTELRFNISINIIIDQAEFVQELKGVKLHVLWDSYSSSGFFKFHVNIYPCANRQLEEQTGPIVSRIPELKSYIR